MLTKEQKDRISDYLQTTDLYIEDGWLCTNNVTVFGKHGIFGDRRIGCIKNSGQAIVNRKNGYAVFDADGSMKFMEGWYYDHKGLRVH